MEWWQRIHLHDNPFERLKGMPENLFNTLVETRIFLKFLKRFDDPKTLFGKVFIVYGQFMQFFRQCTTVH